DLNGRPLLPHHGGGERGDERDDDHRGEQGRAALIAREGRALHGPSATSRMRLPFMLAPENSSTRRTPLGKACRCLGTGVLALPAGCLACWSPVDWQLLQEPQ